MVNMNESTGIKKQYDLINAMRFIAAFFVVAIHVHFPGSFGNGVIAIARFAVPFFFMVSGFFSYYADKTVIPGKMKHKMKHVLVLLLGSISLYFVYYAATNAMNGSFGKFLKSIFSFKSLAAFFIFNHPPFAEHLWFLSALLYVYIVFYVFTKTGFDKKCAFLIPVLSIGGVLFREVKEIFPDFASHAGFLNQAFLYRNFVFVGLPFFLMGYFIRIYADKMTEKLSDSLLIVLMLFGTAEAVLVDAFHTQKSVYLGTILAVFAFFVFMLKLEDKVKVPVLASLGAKYSLYIYIFQVLVIYVVKTAGEVIPIVGKGLDLLNSVMPIVIFILTLAVSVVYVFIKTSLKKGFKKNK